MSAQPGYKNLDYIVARVQSDTGDNSTTNYQRYLQWAINGWKELNLAIMPNIKVGYFTISDIYTVDWPDDYIDYTLIGLVVGGEVVTLSVNPKIPLSRKKDECGEEIVDAVASVASGNKLFDSFLIAPHFRNGQYVGEQYAQGGGFNRYGYFRVDHDMRRFQFQNIMPSLEIVIEYKSSGIDDMGNATVPDDATQCLVDYVHQERTRFDKRASAFDKQMAIRRYEEQFRALRKRRFKFTMSEYLDSKYKNVHMGIKR